MKTSANPSRRRASAPALIVTLMAVMAAATGSAQIAWSGATDNDWLTDSNWVGGDAPDTALETASFSTASANLAPNLSAATTIGRLEFLSGAGSYTISGSPLTIQAIAVRIMNSSGALQTINSNVIMTADAASNNRRVDVTEGSSLTFGGSFTASSSAGGDTSVAFYGQSNGTSTNGTTGGVINFGGNVTANQVQQQEGVTLNINATVTSGVYFSFNNNGRINFNASTTRNAGTGSSSAGHGRIYITTNGVSIGNMEFRGAAGAVSTLGADITGGGTGTVGNVTSNGTTRTNATYKLSAAADNVLNVSGVLSGSAGAGTKYQVEGPGIVRFSGSSANTATTPIEVASGRLELNKTAGVNAIGGGSVTVLSNAEVRLLASNQIADTVTMSLAGGSLNVNGFSETLGALSLAGNSFLALGDGGTATFANSADQWGSFTLSISGTFVSGSSVRFGTDNSGLSGTQLGNINIDGFVGIGIDSGGYLTATAIPEPSTYAALAGLGVLGLAASRRRRSA